MRTFRFLFCYCLFLGCLLSAQAQIGIVIGIAGDSLVKVNLENGEVEALHVLANKPTETNFSNLVYISKDAAFYSTIYADSKPTLVRIRANGYWEIVGELQYDQHSLVYCTALSYDKRTDQLILAGSKTGEHQRSESLFKVNRRDASCHFMASIRYHPAPDDFDEIAVFNGQLFCMDGVENRNTTYIFPLSVNRLRGELFAGTKQNIPYFSMEDVVTIGQLLYFTDKKSGQLYRYDLMARKWKIVAPLQNISGGQLPRLTGLAFLPLSQA